MLHRNYVLLALAACALLFATAANAAWYAKFEGIDATTESSGSGSGIVELVWIVEEAETASLKRNAPANRPSHV